MGPGESAPDDTDDLETECAGNPEYHGGRQHGRKPAWLRESMTGDFV